MSESPSAGADKRTVDFFFDVASPYTYLCATQVDEVVRSAGGTVRWRPILLGALFKAVGNEAPARVPAKAQWMLTDLYRWSSEYGVPFKFPSCFPVNSLKAQRACVVAELRGTVREIAMTFFRAYWTEGLDPSTDEVLARAAGAIGLSPADLMTELEAPSVKQALRANTEAAVAAGAFGAPTMVVSGEVFFGNDRLEHLRAYLKTVT